MKAKSEIKLKKRARGQRGYTLLEYCAGAAIIAGVLWVALSNLGNDLSGLLGSVGQWARTRSSQVQTQ